MWTQSGLIFILISCMLTRLPKMGYMFTQISTISYTKDKKSGKDHHDNGNPNDQVARNFSTDGELLYG